MTMRELLAQVDTAWILVCATALAVAVLLVVLAAWRRRRKAPAGDLRPVPQDLIDVSSGLDTPSIEKAIREAEAKGQHDKLPSLYYVLAQRTIETGETAKAHELLRRSIRGAATADQDEVHARARVVLGDLAHADGDLTTACEHWQIARALFVELKQHGDHESVEARMLRNGCPTDWVLTDF
jgi:hypothetical protein